MRKATRVSSWNQPVGQPGPASAASTSSGGSSHSLGSHPVVFGGAIKGFSDAWADATSVASEAPGSATWIVTSPLFVVVSTSCTLSKLRGEWNKTSFTWP